MKKLSKLFITAMIILSFLLGSLLGYKVNNGDINMPIMIDKNNPVNVLIKHPSILYTIDRVESCWASIKIGTALCYLVIVNEIKSSWVRAP